MAFTPPALDSAEAETFQPPALSAEEFTPPPLTAAEPAGEAPLRAPHVDPKFIGKSPAQQLSDIWQWANSDIATPEDRMRSHLRQMALAQQVSPVEDAEDPLPALPASLDKNPTLNKAAALAEGGVEATAKTLDSMVNTPLGIATLGIGGLPKVAQRAIAGAFAVQMASQTPKLATELGAEMGKPEAERNYTKIGDLMTTAAINTGFTVAAGSHAIKGEPPPVQASEAAAPPANAPVNTVAARAAAMLPEQPGTLDAQMQWLQSGKRDAVLVTPGAIMPALPDGADVHPTDAGTFIFAPDRTSPEAIDQAVTDNKVGELLGYGIADKPAPENTLGVVTIRDANGLEKQAVVTDEENLQSVLAKAKERADAGDTVQLETPEQVIAKRQVQTSAPAELPAVRMAREQRETMAAMRAQDKNTFSPPSLDQEEVANVAPGANGDVKGGQKFPNTGVGSPADEYGAIYGPKLSPEQIAKFEEQEGHEFPLESPAGTTAKLKVKRSMLWLETDKKVPGSLEHEVGVAYLKIRADGTTVLDASHHGRAIDKLAADKLVDFLKRSDGMRRAESMPPTQLKPVEITPEDYKAARQGNNPFMEVETATGLAKDIKRAAEFGSDALNVRAGETEARPVNQLFVGDQFKVKGQPVHVADWVTDAETGEPAGVNVDGAYGRQFVPVDQTVHIDAGSLSDPVSTWFDQAIAATDPLKPGVLMEGVTSAPVWMTKTAVNAALKIAKFAYTKTRDISRSVGEAVRFLRSQNLAGFNEAEALNWLESNLRGDPIFQDTGRALGAATEERQKLENTSAAQQMAGSTITTAPFQQDLLAAVTGIGWRQRVGGWMGSLAGETFPKTTRIFRELGEQGARWISSRAAAIPLGDAFSEDVTRGLGLEDVEFGGMLHEDNLRSIKQSQLAEAQKLDAAGDKAGAAKLRAQAQKVFSFVGDGGVFPDEAAYQEYLKRPAVQAAVQRHIALWERQVNPMFREAMKLDPDAELPARGLQTGARINLNFVREGESIGPNVFEGKTPSATPRGVLSNVLQRRSPFGRLAKGTAEAYRPSYQDAMRNTYSRQLEIANRNKFDRMMVEAGHAVIDRPGKQDEIRIGGEGVSRFEIKRTVIQSDGQRIPAFQDIYVRKSLAAEYHHALNLDPRYHLGVLTPAVRLINGLSLAGLAEMSAHMGNLSQALFLRPGVTQHFWSEIGLSALGRADAFLAVGRALWKFTAEDKARIRELSEIGALREPHGSQSNLDPRKWGGKVIEWADLHTRVQMDRMYQNLAEQGLVPKTETARREFVNQVGQYNRKAQGQFIHMLRDTGVAPFVTAGRAFNVLSLRTALLNPGVETTGFGSRLAVAATMASKVGGTLAIIATTNYLISSARNPDHKGSVFGRPGIPLGAIDLGFNDKNGRPMYLDLANIMGLKRVARVIGVRGAAEALKGHLPFGLVFEAAMRDIGNAWSAPYIGPVTRTFSLAVSGKQPAIGVPRTAPVVPPGQNQFVQNAKTAAIEMNPIMASVHDSREPGATGMEFWQRQLGRFTIQPGKPPQLADPNQYARHVDRANAANFIGDVIMRARRLQGADRAKYVNESIMQLQPQDREMARRTLEERKIILAPPRF